jgi:hypothetical protein
MFGQRDIYGQWMSHSRMSAKLQIAEKNIARSTAEKKEMHITIMTWPSAAE